jgi:hypothetical protein
MRIKRHREGGNRPRVHTPLKLLLEWLIIQEDPQYLYLWLNFDSILPTIHKASLISQFFVSMTRVTLSHWGSNDRSGGVGGLSSTPNAIQREVDAGWDKEEIKCGHLQRNRASRKRRRVRITPEPRKRRHLVVCQCSSVERQFGWRPKECWVWGRRHAGRLLVRFV